MKGELIFVYNAKSDLFSTVTDFAHKILSPSTYDCQLCALTYGDFFMRQDWKSFLESLPVKSRFMYKDEFEKKGYEAASFPAIYLLQDEIIHPFASRREIEACATLEDLKTMISEKIKISDQHYHTGL